MSVHQLCPRHSAVELMWRLRLVQPLRATRQYYPFRRQICCHIPSQRSSSERTFCTTLTSTTSMIRHNHLSSSFSTEQSFVTSTEDLAFSYVTKDVALKQNLTYASGDTFIMRANAQEVLKTSAGRDSVRLVSKGQWGDVCRNILQYRVGAADRSSLGSIHFRPRPSAGRLRHMACIMDSYSGWLANWWRNRYHVRRLSDFKR